MWEASEAAQLIRNSARRGPSALRTCALALLAACATPVNYFQSPGPVLPELTESSRPAMIRLLTPQLEKSGIEVIEVREAGRVKRVSLIEPRSGSLDELPLDALTAAAWGANSELVGAEFDLIVRAGDAPPKRVVTVRHDIDRRLVILLGDAPRTLEDEAPTSEELSARFGIGPLLDGSVSWQPEERAALGAALALMSADELSYLRFLPFRREAAGAEANHAGYYTNSESGFSAGLVVLLDTAFSGDRDVFVGTPERAFPQSVAVILHELGHALAKLDRERLVAAFERDRTKYNELVQVFNDYTEALNARYAVIERPQRIAERRRLEKEVGALEQERRKLKRILDRASGRLNEMADLASGPSPIETAYAALENARLGPTPYGKVSAVEGFAEAFSLYHLDPESIGRFSPAVLAWFERGGHISAALFPPLEDVATPGEVTGAENGSED